MRQEIRVNRIYDSSGAPKESYTKHVTTIDDAMCKCLMRQSYRLVDGRWIECPTPWLALPLVGKPEISCCEQEIRSYQEVNGKHLHIAKVVEQVNGEQRQVGEVWRYYEQNLLMKKLTKTGLSNGRWHLVLGDECIEYQYKIEGDDVIEEERHLVYDYPEGNHIWFCVGKVVTVIGPDKQIVYSYVSDHILRDKTVTRYVNDRYTVYEYYRYDCDTLEERLVSYCKEYNTNKDI